MKRILALITAFVGVIFAVVAERPLVTLSHNGEFSFFQSNNAFEEAVNNSAPGDTIFLTKGVYSASSTVNIPHPVSIIGIGYDSYLCADLEVRSSNSSTIASLYVNGIKIKKISVSGSVGTVEINRSMIEKIDYNPSSGRLEIGGCLIKDGLIRSNGIIRNSKIYNIDIYHFEYVVNCNIKYMFGAPVRAEASIIANYERNGGGNVEYFFNCVVPYVPTYYTMVDCYYRSSDVLDESLNTIIDLEEAGYLGIDGTVVGVYGGESPFSENPSVPTVDSANSSVEYDAESNKLKVTIAVTPR